MNNKQDSWQKSQQYSEEQLETAETVLKEIQAGAPTMKAVRSHPLSEGGFISKHSLVHVYRQRVEDGLMEEDPALLARIRTKPVRSLSGVSTVTALTEPHACPGECLFCPQEAGLPGSWSMATGHTLRIRESIR